MHYRQQAARNEVRSQGKGKGRSVASVCNVDFDAKLTRGLFSYVQVRLLSYHRHLGQVRDGSGGGEGSSEMNFERVGMLTCGIWCSRRRRVRSYR